MIEILLFCLVAVQASRFVLEFIALRLNLSQDALLKEATSAQTRSVGAVEQHISLKQAERTHGGSTVEN